MSSSDPREDLISSVLRAIRKLTSQGSLFGQTVAGKLGLAGTDVDCLEILGEEGSLTVGRLAELTGLTTGSATRMVDRLEQAGFVRRVPDQADRRRVLVEPAAGVGQKLGAMLASFQEAQRAMIAAYDDAQLATIEEFLQRNVEVARAETERLRAPDEALGIGGSFAAPVGGATSARLVFLSGAPSVRLSGDPAIAELYRARFEGAVPRVRVRDGVVTVQYGRFSWLDWRARIGDMRLDASLHVRPDRGEIALNAAIPWAVELRGGLSRLVADLREVRLESLELRGGASRLELTLPPARGVVPVRVAGGASMVTIRAPAGAAIRMRVSGGASVVTLDGQRITTAGTMVVGPVPATPGTPPGPGEAGWSPSSGGAWPGDAGRGASAPGGGGSAGGRGGSARGRERSWSGSGLAVETPDAGRSADRYEVEVSGGASRVTVERR